MRTATEFVTAVENTLGWEPPESQPRWKAVQVEAAKVNRKIATNPALFTWANLQLALELLRRERKEVKSPAAVLWHVERALAQAAVEEQTDDLDEQVQKAVTEAMEAGAYEWVERLVRSRGDGRSEALRAWRSR